MKDEFSQNFRELNLTILTSIGLGLSLGMIGEIGSAILIENNRSQYAFPLLSIFIGITILFASLIIWLSLPKVQIRDFIPCATTYDTSKKIFFDYFYEYDEFGMSIHHLSRLINEKSPLKTSFETDDNLVLYLAQYVVLRLLFLDLHLYYRDTRSLNVAAIFDNKIFQNLSRVSNYRLNLPQEFTIKRAENSLLVIEGDNLRFKIFGAIRFSQSVGALYLRPIPRIRDIPIRPLYEEEIVSKIISNDFLRLYFFDFDIQIEYINSKFQSILSKIRRNSKFPDKVDMITNLIHRLREQISVTVLIERIYQKIEEDRLENFFESERRKQR